MNRVKDLKRYSKHFVENFNKYLNPGFQISVDVYPVNEQGAVLEFKINKNKNKRITLHDSSQKIGLALAKVKQNLIGGDLSNVNFGGTNLVLENDRIIVIKGDNDQNSWSNRAILDDIKRVIEPKKGADSAKSS